MREHDLLVRIAAAPVDDAANDALVDFLTRALGLPRRAAHIVSGARGRRKRIALSGISADAVRARLKL
jgi:uncharacterized protein YggU (UPF0235/DUF167 family)